MKTAVVPNNPYVLEQVQRAHHLAENALEKLCKVDVTNLGKDSIFAMMQVLEEVLLVLQTSREELGYSQKHKLTSISQSTIQKRFTTPLPDGVVLNFGVDDGQLLVAVYGITFSNSESSAKAAAAATHSGTGSLDTRGKETGDKGKMFVFCFFQLHFFSQKQPLSRINISDSNNKDVYGFVSEHIFTHVRVDYLRNALDDLSLAFKICSRLRDKLLVHSVYTN